MPFTSNKRYSVQTAGSNTGTWGAGTADSLNEGVFEIMDANMGGITALSLASSNTLLTQTQAYNGLIRCTGVLLANVSISPDAGVVMTGFYYFENLTTGSFTVTLSNGAGSVVLPQGRRGVVWIDGTNGPRIMSLVGSAAADVLPTGTAMLFYNSAAPTGWTLYTTVNDCNVALNRTVSGNATGSILYSTVFGRTATDSTTLTLDQIPSHSHTYAYPQGGGLFGTGASGAAVYGSTETRNSGNSGGGNGHTHGIDLRVFTVNMLIATRV